MQPRTLLLVEDNPDDEVLLRRGLRQRLPNLVPRIASHGVEALRMIQDKRSPLPVAVLLDLKMPRMGGFDVLEAIRGEERTRYVPVVIFSSSNEPSDIRQAYRLGA